MKSLIGQFPTKAFVGWTEDARIEKARARLSRVVGRHQVKPPPPLKLSPAVCPVVPADSGTEPLYDSSVYLSVLPDEDMLEAHE